jgi:hypothetical protein
VGAWRDRSLPRGEKPYYCRTMEAASATSRDGAEAIFVRQLAVSQRVVRADYLKRGQRSLEDDWKGFNAEERAAIWNHVVHFDYPESRESFTEMRCKRGFAPLLEVGGRRA